MFSIFCTYILCQKYLNCLFTGKFMTLLFSFIKMLLIKLINSLLVPEIWILTLQVDTICLIFLVHVVLQINKVQRSQEGLLPQPAPFSLFFVSSPIIEPEWIYQRAVRLVWDSVDSNNFLHLDFHVGVISCSSHLCKKALTTQFLLIFFYLRVLNFHFTYFLIFVSTYHLKL